MYPTENQSLYILKLEENLLRSLYAILYSSLGDLRGIKIVRKFPKTMTNDDVQNVIKALKNFSNISRSLTEKRYNKIEISKQEVFALTEQYKILEQYFHIPPVMMIREGILEKW